ncbi:hypothetical protein B0H63DRAFT_69991 [Podospora didyma]|uniref:Uncharacterized protein n=1 Tax=Podospora didyma TaxID=330526 RepID=A0AAE0K2D9_9PEZI|nr:hypothetical protein B0H63DRAFT_69991 [Podospora didyma]
MGEGMAPLYETTRSEELQTSRRDAIQIRQDKDDTEEKDGSARGRFRNRLKGDGEPDTPDDSKDRGGPGSSGNNGGGGNGGFGGGRRKGSGNNNEDADNEADNSGDKGRGSRFGGKGNGRGGSSDKAENNTDDGKDSKTGSGNGFGSGKGNGSGGNKNDSGDKKNNNGNSDSNAPKLSSSIATATSPETAPTATADPGTATLASSASSSSSSEANPIATTSDLPATTALAQTLPDGSEALKNDAGAANTSPSASFLGPAPTALPDTAALTPLPVLINGTASSNGNQENGISPVNSNGNSNGSPIGNDSGSNTTTDALQANGSPMDPMAERALVSAGSIGAFILVSFIVWIVWRTMKKSKANADKPSSRSGSRPFKKIFSGGLVTRLPFLKGRKRWQNLDDTAAPPSSPPSYREKASVAAPSEMDGFYGQEKVRLQMPQRESLGMSGTNQPPSVPPLHLETSSLQTLNNGGTYTTISPVSTGGSYPTNSSVSAARSLNQMASSHLPQDSFSSTNAAQFGTMTMSAESINTMRSRMGPDMFFNQSEMARQPSEAYDPARRQPNRVSQLSSISSGFGDGDIIVTPPKPVVVTSRAESSNYAPARFSWMSQSQALSRRDTVYTQTSEDSPPRFRTVTSWVDQQTGRIRRVQQQDLAAAPPVPQLIPGHPGIPGIHNPPDEQVFNMMMTDNESPRRVEDAMAMRS